MAQTTIPPIFGLWRPPRFSNHHREGGSGVFGRSENTSRRLPLVRLVGIPAGEMIASMSSAELAKLKPFLQQENGAARSIGFADPAQIRAHLAGRIQQKNKE